MTTRTLEQFLSDMQPFYDLFDGVDDLHNYYSACQAGMLRLAAVYVRVAVRRIGYDALAPLACPAQAATLAAALGASDPKLVPWERVCRMIPADFVVSVPQRLYGTQLVGNYPMEDLISVAADGSVQLAHRGVLFRDMLVNYYAASPRGRDGLLTAPDELLRRLERLRGKDDISSLYEWALVTQFLRACGEARLPGRVWSSLRGCSWDARATAMTRLHARAREMILVDGTLLSDHVIAGVREWSQMKSLAATIGSSAGGRLSAFLSAFRLDPDFAPSA